MNLQHPCDTNTIYSFGEFPSKQTMYRRLALLRRAGVIRIVGFVPNDGESGRPVDVYAVDRWKADNMQHEVALSRVLLHWGVPAIRGRHVDPKLLPDATLLCDAPVHVELDTGSMNWNRQTARMKKYRECQDNVIFVTLSALRVDRVLKNCPFLASTLLACTYEEALHEAELTDCEGEKITLNNLLNNLSDDQQAE